MEKDSDGVAFFESMKAAMVKLREEYKGVAGPKLMPPRYVEFLTTGEYRKFADHSRKFGSSPQKFKFTDGRLVTHLATREGFDRIVELLKKEPARTFCFWPFTQLWGKAGPSSSMALYIDLSKVTCPVFKVDEGGIEQVGFALNAFLNSLTAGSGGEDEEDDEEADEADEEVEDDEEADEKDEEDGEEADEDEDEGDEDDEYVGGIPKTPEERRRKVARFLDKVDWKTYDYTKVPAGDMTFPDYTEEECAARDIWISKHYNYDRKEWKCVHVLDLNDMTDGFERRLFGLYGIPVEWPTKDSEKDEREELLNELDEARARGGATFEKALTEHGLLNDEHYLWVRYRYLGAPKHIRDHARARKVIAEVDAAKTDVERTEVLEGHSFRDQLHYDHWKAMIVRAEERANKQQAAGYQQAMKTVEARLEANKAALAGELAPFKGVSLEAWAEVNVRRSRQEALEAILADLKIERPLWDEVDAEWNGRMSRDTTATIATIYGQSFAKTFAKKAEAQKPAGDGMTFEQWVKIQSHVSAASRQGVDPSAVLKKYGLTPAEFGTCPWGIEFAQNPMKYMQDYQTFSAKYAQEFASLKAGSDIEF
jgi:hypothetical protein